MADAEFILDTKEWDKFLSSVSKRLNTIKNSREFGGIISSVVYGDVMDHFDKEMGPDSKWEPWSDSYTASIMGLVQFRNINGRTVPMYATNKLFKPPRKDGKILQATGRLRQSFKPNKFRTTSDGPVFYNNAKTKTGFPYAYAHDNDEDSRKQLPRRSFMWLSQSGMSKMIDVTEKWLIGW